MGHGRNSTGEFRMGRARGGIEAWNRGIKESDLSVREKALCLRPGKGELLREEEVGRAQSGRR